MPWKCPECQEEVNRLNYSVPISEIEYGEADLSDTNQEGNERVLDHDSNDNSGSEWDGTPKYTCRECDATILIRDLIWFEDNGETLEDELTSVMNDLLDKPKIVKKLLEEDEETTHNIIKPERNIISKDERKNALQSTIICKSCFTAIIYEAGRDNGYQNEVYCMCPKCFTENSQEEFQKLIKEGHYD